MLRSSLTAAVPDAIEHDLSDLLPDKDVSAGDEAEQSGADRRAHKRLTLAEVPFVSKVRLKYGPAVTLIDLSSGGAQIETTNFRLQPGSMVVIEIASQEGELTIPAQVLRCQLASLLPEPLYRGSLVFKRPLDFKDLGSDSFAQAASDLNPALEHARLRHLLKRLIIEAPGRPADDVLPPAIYEALGAALSTLETPAGRRSGPTLAVELAGLFKAMTDLLVTTPTSTALIVCIEEQLKQCVRARAIRLADDESFLQLPGSEAVFFAVPSLDPATPAARIVVEFAEGCEPLESHFQLMKAGVALVAIAREIGRLNGPERPLTLRPEERLPAGWSCIVVRYINGQMLKGFTQNFVATKGFLHLSPEPSPDARTAVPFTEVKAIFFVRDHEGNSGYAESKRLDPSIRGRGVSVTFGDDEELIGTTVNYNSSAPGFFVHPADPESNNERVFIVAASVRAVKFL